MTPPPLRAVLFDAAGTLIELREGVGESYARLARPFGVTLAAERLDDAFRRCLAGAPPLVFPDARPGEIDTLERDWWRALVRSTWRAADSSLAGRFPGFDAYFDALYAHFADPNNWQTTRGAREALSALRARQLTTGVVSNFDRRLGGLLAGLGLAPLLDLVVLPSDAAAAKPDPAIFLHALNQLGISPAEALYLGDDQKDDVVAARRAGLRAIHVESLATLDDLPARLEEAAS